MKWLDRTEAVRWNECRIRHNQGMGFGKSEFDPKEPFHVGEVLDQEYGLVQTFGIPMTAELISKQYSEQRRSVVEKRSEEHTSELQSRSDLVCRLLLEKKKKETASRSKRCSVRHR